MEQCENTKILRRIKSLTEQIERSRGNNDDIYFQRAMLYRGIGEYRRAIDDYKAIIQIYPKDVDSYFAIAECAFLLGSYEEVVEYCTKAIEIDSRDCDYYIFRMSANIELNNYDDVIKDSKMALNISNKPQIHYNLARMYYKLKDKTNALKEILEAKHLSFGDEDICDDISQLEQLINNMEIEDGGEDSCDFDFSYEKALELFLEEKYEDSLAEFETVLTRLYQCKEISEKKHISNEKAKSLNEELISDCSTLIKYGLIFKGVVECKLEDYEKSIETFSKIINMDKVCGLAFMYRAMAYLKLNIYEKALFDCSSAEYCINIANYPQEDDFSLEAIQNLRQDILKAQKEDNESNARIDITESNKDVINLLNKLFYSK